MFRFKEYSVPLHICAAILLAVASVCYSGPAFGQANFTDKTITVIVPFKAGGGTDVWARFWSPLIADKLPGRPKIKVINQPGGGGTTGANDFYENSSDDGMVLLASSASVLYAYLLGDLRVKYEYKDWRALLASPTGGAVYASPEVLGTEGDIGLSNMKDKEWSAYIQGPTQLGLMMMLSLEVLDLDFKVAFGASGGVATFEGFRNGFYDIDMQTTASYLTNVDNLINSGKARTLFSMGAVGEDNKIVRDPTFQDFPTLPEFHRILYGSEASGPAFEAWKKFFLAGFPSQKMLLLPATTDPKVIKAYDIAIDRVISETTSWPATKDQILGEYRQVTGEAANSVMLEATSLDEETLAWYKNWLLERFQIKI